MIVRHRPTTARALDPFDRAFDQLTASFFEPRRRSGPHLEATWNDEALVLTVDLPGVPADAVSVEVAGRVLTLGVDTDSYQWSRSLTIGERLDPDKVEARHVDGRLTVKLGAVDEPEARRVAIDTSPAPAIEATADDADSGADTDES